MTHKDRFATISPTLIQYLNAEFTNWEELIPEDYDTLNLNERSLIQLLKDNKHRKLDEFASEHYQEEIRKLSSDSGRSFLDAMKSSIEFHTDAADQWYEFETKLNNVFIEFEAKQAKITNANQLKQAISSFSDSVNEEYLKLEEGAVNFIHKSFENYFQTRFVPLSGTSGAKPDIIGSQISKFKQTIKDNIRETKKFLDSTINDAIRTKISLIEKGELPLNAFSRSDLFTDEEIKNIHHKQDQLLINIINRNKPI